MISERPSKYALTAIAKHFHSNIIENEKKKNLKQNFCIMMNVIIKYLD